MPVVLGTDMRMMGTEVGIRDAHLLRNEKRATTGR